MLFRSEVQTGFARTGKMFAIEHFGIDPDIITLSKAIAHGLPAAATVAKAEIMDWDLNSHEGTLNGGPIIMEAAKAVLSVIDEEKLVEKAKTQGDYLKKSILELAKKYPIIGDVRGIGLMVGIEFVKDLKKTPAKDKRDKLLNDAFMKGLLLLGAGESSIRLAPPMVITTEQINQGLTILEDCLKKL